MKPESAYKIPNITPATEELLMSNVNLVLLNVTRVPPHLSLAVNGKLFSLSVKGQTIGSDLSSLLRSIRHRSIESIFIQLRVPEALTVDNIEEEIGKHVLAYPRVDVGIATCLAPIKDLCSSIYGIDTGDVNFIYELLPRLEQVNAISRCYHLNLEKHLVGNDFFLDRYTMRDIDDEIRRASVLLTV